MTWESPDFDNPVTGYVIYYQPEEGAVSSDIVSGGETETYLLDGLQRGLTYNISIVALSLHLSSLLVVTYNISIVALSLHLPSLLVGPVAVTTGLVCSVTSHTR